MFIITDGKNYVMKNPMQNGRYLATTSPVQAAEFTYKQARALVQHPRSYMKWVKGYQIVDLETKSVENKYTKSNEGVYIGNKDINFDSSLIEMIRKEKEAILRCEGWTQDQLNTFEEQLSASLSKYDSVESDIVHALREYREKHNGKKPAAHKMSKIAYLLEDADEHRRDIKECQRFISVMQDAITYHYGLSKLKYELSRAETTPYKGRTEYYKQALDILEG